MPNDIDPIVDTWYTYLDKGQRFIVTSIDEDEGTVEVQHFDGDLEDIDISDWYNLEIELSSEPENWSGPLDIAELDDLGTEVTDTAEEDWSEPLQQFRKKDTEKLTTDTEEDIDDEWEKGFIAEESLEIEK